MTDEERIANDVFHTLAGHERVEHVLRPQWDMVKCKWHWGGTHEELAQLIREMKLTYGVICVDGYCEPGPDIIKPNDPVWTHLRDINDPIFNHESLQITLSKWEGDPWDLTTVMDLNDPIKKFMYLTLSAAKNISSLTYASLRSTASSNHELSRLNRKNNYQGRILLNVHNSDKLLP